jgi:hypothetical protein
MADAAPVTELIVATAVLLLLHAPPDTPSVKVPVAPAQKEEVPVIAPGVVCTVTVVAAGVPQPSA